MEEAMNKSCVDLASSEIAKWLSMNFMDLLGTVKNYGFEGTMTKSKTKNKKRTLDMVHAVLQVSFVRQFPCVRNVEVAAKKFLKSCFRAAESRFSSNRRAKDIYIKCGKRRLKLSFPDGLEFKQKTGPPRRSSGDDQENAPQPVEDAELRGYIRVQTRLHDALQYWKIINKAAFYDHRPGSFQKDLKRFGLKWKGKIIIKREMLATFAGAASSASPYLEGVGRELKGYYGDLGAGQPHFRMQMKDLIEHLIPLVSQSRAVGSVVDVKDEESESRGTPVVWNNRCEPFWNSLYLFHVTGRKGAEKGVALNTVSGVVHNADFRYANRFECVLTPATTNRWAKFVSGGDERIRWDSFQRLTRDMWLNAEFVTRKF